MTISTDFVEFFGKAREEMIAEHEINYPEMRRKLYYKTKPTNDAEARSMYLDPWYSIHYLKNLTDDFFERIEEEVKNEYYLVNGNMVAIGIADNKPKGSTVLDYGTGHAQYGLWMHYLGYKVTLCDIPHNYFRFLEFLCNKRNMGIKFVPINDELADLPEQYDSCICSEMLEHCWEPMKVLTYLVSKLKKYGLIYISDFYDDCQGADPSHLKHNNTFQDVEFKFKQYASTGIEPFVYDKNNILKVWRKYE